MELAKRIKQVRKNNPNCYGARRLALEFYKKYKIKIGRRTIMRYIDGMNLDTRQYDYSVNLRHRAAPKIKNLLLDDKRKPNFTSSRRNKILVCDLSQLFANENKGKTLQVFALMDLHSRYIVNYDFSNFESTNEMVMKVISSTIKKYRPKIIHSDCGREFSSWDYYHTCEQNNVSVSHSKPGKPTHNACIESFFKTLKHEINLRKLVKTKTPEQIKTIVRK
jgi:transposase InsO family protein